MHGVEITDYESSDIEMMDSLIPDDGSIIVEKVIADGSYYSIEGVENMSSKGDYSRHSATFTCCCSRVARYNNLINKWNSFGKCVSVKVG